MFGLFVLWVKFLGQKVYHLCADNGFDPHPHPQNLLHSSGASGGSLHGGASFKVEKALFAALPKGPGELQK